jgi:hypothetical protein
MRIPQYQSQLQPGATELPMPSAQAAMAPGRALAQFGRQIGVSGEQWAQVEQTIQRERDVNTLATMTGEARERANALDLDLTIGRRDEQGRVIEAAPDSAAYLPTFDTRWRELSTDILDRAPNPRVRQALQRSLATLGTQRRAHAQAQMFDRFKDENEGAINTTEQAVEAEIGRTQDPAVQEQLINQHVDGYLALKRPGMGEAKYVQRRQAFLERVRTNQVTQQARDPVRRNALIPALLNGELADIPTAAQYKLGATLQDEADRKGKEHQTTLEKQQKAEYTLIIDDLHRRASEGKLSEPELREWEQRWDIQREDRNAIRAAMENSAKYRDRPSTPAIYNRFVADVYTANPQTTEGQLLASYQSWLAGGEGINGDKFRELSGELRGRREKARTEGQTRLGRDHAQAEQVLRAGLNIPANPLQKLDPKEEFLWSQAITLLTERSAYFNGREDPLEAANAILAIYRPVAQSETFLDWASLDRITPYKTVEALDRALAQGDITSAQHRVYQENLTRRATLREQVKRLTGKDPEEAITPTPTPTPTPTAAPTPPPGGPTPAGGELGERAREVGKTPLGWIRGKMERGEAIIRKEAPQALEPPPGVKMTPPGKVTTAPGTLGRESAGPPAPKVTIPLPGRKIEVPVPEWLRKKVAPMLPGAVKPSALQDLESPEGKGKITRTAHKYGVDPAFLVALRRTEAGGPGREFGIISVSAPTYDEQLDWAARSVAAAEKRFEATGQSARDPGGRYTPEFIRSFSNRYAKVGAPNDPKGLNRNHAPNLIALYGRGGEVG